MRKLRHLLPILAVLAVALFLRVHRLPELPPGFHYDEGANALLTELLLREKRPVAIFPAYAGRESFVFYFFALSFATLGHSVWALRLPVALLGVLAVAGVYRLTLELLWSWPLRRWAATGAALFLATSPWHVVLTRDALRASTVGLVGALFLAAWVRAWRRGTWRAYGAAGGLLGLLAYTYSAVRVLPLAVFLLGIWVVWRQGRRAAAGMAVMVLVAGVVAAPLGWALWRMPEHLTLRAGQASILSDYWTSGTAAEELLESAGAVAGMFFLRGDPVPRFNALGAPIWDPLEAALAAVGVVLLARRPGRRAGVVIITWAAAAILPPLLSADIRPAFVRSVGLLPVIFVPPGVGLAWLAARLRRPGAGAGVVGAVAAVSVAYVAALYFGPWARDWRTYLDYQTPEAQAARLAGRELALGHTVLMAARDYKNPAMVFLSPELEGERWFDGIWSLPAAAGGGGGTVAYVATTADVAGAWQQLLDRAAQEKVTALAPWGEPAARAWRVPPDLLTTADLVGAGPIGEPAGNRKGASVDGEPVAHPGGVSLNGELEFLGGAVPEEASRGRLAEVRADLKILRAPGRPRALAVHLLDAGGFSRGQVDNLGYLAAEWREGDRFLQRWELSVGGDVPPGNYQVRLFMTDEQGRQLPTLDGTGQPVGVGIELGTVRIVPSGGLVEASIQGREVVPGLRLREAAILGERLAPGEDLVLRLRWQRDRQEPAGAPLRLRVGEASWKVGPVEGYPPTEWQVGEIVETWHRLRLPLDLEPGEVAVVLEEMELGRVTIDDLPMITEEPAVPRRLEAQAGDFARLLGWKVDPIRAGEPFELTLYWQAQGAAGTSYKVFTHLLDGSGRLVSQMDRMPGAGARPTTGWRAGEYLIDSYVLTPPAPGEYAIEVGLYHPETLERVAVELPDGGRPPERRILLGSVTVP